MMNSVFFYQNIVTCKLNSSDQHIFRCPKVLPCGFKACLDCIKNEIKKNGFVRCNFAECKEEHQIDDPNKLISDKTIELALIENAQYLTYSLLEKLEKQFESFKNSLKEKEENIETYFDFIKTEIVIRIESLKSKLDNLENDLLHIATKLKERCSATLINEFELYKQNYKEIMSSLSSKEQSLSNETLLNSSSKTNIYTCQDFLNELNNFDKKFQDKLNQFSFHVSDFQPTLVDIGTFNGFDILHSVISVIEPKIINLDYSAEKVRGLASVNNDKLLITDSSDNKIIVLDSKYRLIKKISRIEKTFFRTPYGICSDNNGENIYICDYGNNRVLVIDNQFVKLKRIIGKYGHNICEFDGPIDICYSSLLYVLDQHNKRIQLFNKFGDYIKELKLYNKNSNLDDRFLSNPTRIGVTDNALAVLNNWENLYLYDLNGCLVQIIEAKNIESFCFYSTYLFTLNDESLLICYEQKQNLGKDVYFEYSYQRSLANLNLSSAFMCIFNGHLIVSLTNQKHIVIF